MCGACFMCFSPVLVWDGPSVLSLHPPLLPAFLYLTWLPSLPSSTCLIVSSPFPQVFKPTSPSGPGCLAFEAVISVSVSSLVRSVDWVWNPAASDLGLKRSTTSDWNKRPDTGIVPALDRLWCSAHGKIFAVKNGTKMVPPSPWTSAFPGGNGKNEMFLLWNAASLVSRFPHLFSSASHNFLP